MKKGINILLSAAMILFFSLTVYADDDAIEYFKEMRENLYSSLPDSFSGELSGDTIEEKLETIPEDYIESDGAYVELSFSKTDGVDIEVENVDFLYRDLFEQYVRFFTLGPVLSTQSEDTVLSRYDISYTSDADEMVVLNLRYQNADNNFDIYVNTSTYQIIKVEYFMDDELLSSILVQYESVSDSGNQYSVPSKFFVKTFDSDYETLDIFEIKNIEVN